jgi:hypothetical protein
MPDLTLPTIHLNGTSRATLSEGYGAAYRALQDATRAFNAIEFNCRDYYVQPADAWARATTQREVMRSHLRSVQDYLEAHLIHLGD